MVGSALGASRELSPPVIIIELQRCGPSKMVLEPWLKLQNKLIS